MVCNFRALSGCLHLDGLRLDLAGLHILMHSLFLLAPLACRHTAAWAQRTVKLTRNPALCELWTQGCSLLLLSQQTRRLWARFCRVGLAGAARCHWGRASKRNSKWHELTAESLCLSQAACKRKCKFSNRFFPVLCSIVQKLLLALCPGESKCSFPHLSFTQSNPVFL